MATGKRIARPYQIYELEITLLGVGPRVWRRFAVRDNHSLMVLHDIIQMVMGWKDCHLHEFDIGGQIYAARGFEIDGEDRPVRNEKRGYLRDVLGGQGFRFRYQYDFGDNWQHELKVVKVSPAEPGARYPVCLAGERACPPEDVGGVPGYEESLEALADPQHVEHQHMLDWVGGEFDPEAFDMKRVYWMLQNIR
jgi:hypothetical protein